MSAGKYRKEHNCLNCGFEVEEHFCSRCGQPNLELKENFWQFISHSIAHYFHFDNKFFQTLTPLITKPGKVTLDYLAGKRARYINPISMYIFVSIVYFLVVYTPDKKKIDRAKKLSPSEISSQKKVLDSIENPLQEAGIHIEGVSRSIKEKLYRDNFKKLSASQQDSILQDLRAAYAVEQTDSLKEVIDKLSTSHIIKNDSTYASYLIRQQKLALLEKDNWFERMIKKREIEIGQKSDVIDNQLEHNRPKQYFLLMPLMALFISLNFRKNHIYYLNHLIFTIHGMTAFFLVSIFTQPLIKHVFGSNSVMGLIIGLGVIVWIFWYMYKALQVFYQRKRSAIIWRMIWIFALYGIAIKVTELIIINIIYYVAV